MSELGVPGTLQAGSRRAEFFECLPLACYACDCAGVITDCNRRAIELLGREPQATDRFTVAHKILDAQGIPLPPAATATAFLLKSGLAQLNKEIVVERPDGRRVTALSNVAPLLDEGGNVIGALDVLPDITDRRWLEEARRTAVRVQASVRVASEVAQLKPALLSMLRTLDLFDRETTLDQALNYAKLMRGELVHFDALLKHMAHLAGAA